MILNRTGINQRALTVPYFVSAIVATRSQVQILIRPIQTKDGAVVCSPLQRMYKMKTKTSDIDSIIVQQTFINLLLAANGLIAMKEPVQ